MPLTDSMITVLLVMYAFPVNSNIPFDVISPSLTVISLLTVKPFCNSTSPVINISLLKPFSLNA